MFVNNEWKTRVRNTEADVAVMFPPRYLDLSNEQYAVVSLVLQSLHCQQPKIFGSG